MVSEPAPTVVYSNENIAVRIKKTKEPVRETKVIESKKPNKRGRKSFRDMDNEVDLIDIPDDAVLNQKLYYSISEVAGWFKVNTSLLRYWENEFDILQPRKTRKGDRLFRVEDVKNLQLIYFLLRQRKFSIEGAKNYLKNNKAQADMQAQLVQSLTKFKSFLLELRANLVVQ
ncbi:MAG: MerR family transcriptional regulator [Chitinophagaceae bacterium]|nr:MerR family transcriptional regulator [Chitinophagaceae bacterium]